MENLEQTAYDRLLASLNPSKALRVFNGNRERGFWGDNPHDRDYTEVIALVMSELYEGFEALRKSKRADADYVNELAAETFSWEKPFDKTGFEQFIKDTLEDEVADTLIRALDLYGYTVWAIDPNMEETHQLLNKTSAAYPSYAVAILKLGEHASRAKSRLNVWFDQDESFHNNLFQLATFAKLAMHVCISIADELGFTDTLQKHVDLKLAYNATRPFKHGKAF